MLARTRRVAAAALTVAALASCNGAGATANVTLPSTPYVITILNYTFDPADLSVPPGQTVLVKNLDDVDHWLQSSAAPGQYVHAAVGGLDLDLLVPARDERVFSVPADAVVGTVVPYFCRLSQGAMVNQGTITIAAPAG